MTKLATMGTSSCATIAIGGFKGKEAYDLNESYRANPDEFVEPENSVGDFYENVLYPTTQKLGRTDDYPFDALMAAINESSMKDKFIIATLNQYQMNYKDGYWPARFAEHGFTMFDATKNNIGQPCFLFSRNLARIPMDVSNEEEEEEDFDGFDEDDDS